MTTQRSIRISILLLRYSLVLLLLIIGADKAFHTELITDWEAYLGWLSALIPLEPELIVRIQGGIEIMIAALILLTRYVRTAAALFIVSALCVIADLVSLRFYVLIVWESLAIVSATVLILLATGKGSAPLK